MRGHAWKPFARTLSAMRAEGGYDSARAFYLASGGRPFFGATYRQYLNVENGISGPGPRLVERIALALRLSTDKRRARDFFKAYLRCLVASDALLEVVLSAFAEAPASSSSALQPALARQSADRAVALTREQADCLESSLENFWVWTLLFTDDARHPAPELAALTGLKPAAVAAALRSLHRAGLVEKDAQERWRGLHSDKVLRFPRDEHFDLRRERQRAHIEKIATGRDKTIFRYYTLMRASEREIRGYTPYLFSAVEGANVCAQNEKGPDTGLTLVEVTARKIFPY